MNVADLLIDGFERVRETVHGVLDEVSGDALTARPEGTGNSIAWLVWHLTRVQDDHVADAAGRDQVWTADGWADRFDLPFDASAIGYGFDSAQVDDVRVGAQLLGEYYDAVHAATVAYVARLSPDDLDRVVDDHWDPPVTLGVRLMSVLNDDLQHAGQAAYVAGLG